MKRWMFNITAVFSLLLLLVTVGLWVVRLIHTPLDYALRYESIESGINFWYKSYFGEYRMAIPHWFITLIFAILPTIWLYKWNKRRKLGPNACPSCGYDLTGNTSGVCPECGERIQEAELNLPD